jgi:hypothetical protein
MSVLYITKAQPNPPGRDHVSYGWATNAQLNEEWVEFRAEDDRNLNGDVLTHLTFDSNCRVSGSDQLMTFSGVLKRGQSIRVHTGTGTAYLAGSTYHMYVGASWYKWNNACGDVATLAFNGTVIDSATYRPSPPEGELIRQAGTNLLVPIAAGYTWR